MLPEADASQWQVLSRSGDRVECHASPFAQAVRIRATCGGPPPLSPPSLSPGRSEVLHAFFDQLTRPVRTLPGRPGHRHVEGRAREGRCDDTPVISPSPTVTSVPAIPDIHSTDIALTTCIATQTQFIVANTGGRRSRGPLAARAILSHLTAEHWMGKAAGCGNTWNLGQRDDHRHSAVSAQLATADQRQLYALSAPG